ncbi:hypothetical protein [Streptomyces asiaticus]|uniref:hypothetical protein n=1 Tax=Streptomyces asiaticus TaxID=114695 RepID=UPI00380B26ED
MSGARTRTTGLVALWRVALAGALLCGIGLLPWLSRTDPARTVLKARAADRDPSPELLEPLRSQRVLDAAPLDYAERAPWAVLAPAAALALLGLLAVTASGGVRRPRRRPRIDDCPGRGGD